MSASGRRRLPRGTVIAIEIAVFAGLLSAILFGLNYARGRLDRMVGQLQEQVSGQVAERLGARLRYGTVAPSALRALRVADLELVTETGDVLLSARSLRVHYSLRTLLNTRSAVDAVRRVELTGVVADVHLPRDEMPVLAALGGIGGAGGGEMRAGALPWPLDVSDARVTVTTGGARLRLDELSLRVEPDGDRLLLVDGRARLDAALADVAGHATQIETRIRAAGSLQPGQAGAEATVRLGEVRTTFGTLAARDVQAAWDGTAIFLQTPQEGAGPGFEIRIDPQQGMLRIAAQVQALRPVDVFRPAGPLEHLSPWFEATVSGGAAVNVDAGGVDYVATLQVASPPDLLTDLLGVPVEGEVTVRGNAAVANVTPLVVRAAAGALRFDGSIEVAAGRAAGRLAATDLDLDGRAVSAAAEVVADIPAARLALTDGVLSIGSVTTGGVTGSVALVGRDASGADTGGADAGGADAPTLHFDLAAVLPESPDGRTTAAGALTLGAQPAFAGSVRFREVNAGVLYRWLQPGDSTDPAAADLADGLVVSGQLEGSADPDRLAFNVTAASVTEVDGPLRARFNAALSRDSVRIADLDLTAGDRFRAFGSADADADRLSFTGQIYLDGEPLPGAFRMEAGDGLTVRGPFDLNLHLWPGERLPAADLLPRIVAAAGGQSTPFRLNAAGYPLPQLGDGATAAVDLAGTVGNAPALLAGIGAGAEIDLAAAGLDLTGSRLIVRDLPIGDLPNRLEVEFALAGDVFTADRYRFTNAYFEDRGTAVTGGGVLRVTTVDGLGAAGELLLQVGQERYDAAVSIAAGRLSIDADVERLPLDRLAALPFAGTASGRIRMSGPIAQPVISAELTSSDILLNEDYLTLAAAATYDGASLSIDDLAVDYQNHRVRGVTGRVDTALGTVALAGSYEGEFLGRPMAMDLAVAGTGAFADGATPGRTQLVEAEVIVVANAVTIGDQNRAPWDAQVRYRDGALAFTGGPLDGLSGSLSPDGTFEVVASASLPLHGAVRGAVTDDGVDADLSLSVDLTLLNDVLQTTAVTFLEGSATGDVRVRGPINDPDLYGILQAAGVVVDSPLITERVGPVAFPVVLDGKTLTLQRTRPERGSAPVAVSGNVRMERWAPVAYDIDVRSTTPEGVPVDYRFGPILVAGAAHGGVRITGDTIGTYIAGDVGASNARVFIAAAESPPAWEPLTVDLTVATGRGVELTWPSEGLPILTMLADADQTVAIRYDGFTGAYSVVGDVALRGDLFLINRTFYLRDGLVSFTEDESRFDPTVTVRAETRERDDDETLRVYVDVDSRLSMVDPQNVQVSSNPTRPRPRLEAMLGPPFGTVGAQPRAVEGDGNGAAADLLALAGGAVSQFGLVGPMEREVRQSLGLDLFSIRTDIVSNLLRTPLGVTRPDLLDNTTIVVGKYIGDDLFFEGRMRVESDDAPASAELQLELSLEWPTPFFRLEWSVLPSLSDPFETNNELSMSWRFKY